MRGGAETSTCRAWPAALATSRYRTVTSCRRQRRAIREGAPGAPGCRARPRTDQAGLPQRPQVAERVDAGGVAAGEADLEGVAADQAYVRDPQLVLRQLGDRVQPARDAGLAPALRARARPAQLAAGVAGPGAVVPGDHQHVLVPDQVDRGRERFVAVQRTLITGSCRKDWIDVRAATCDASAVNAFAAGESGRETTIGAPPSASTRMSSCSGMAPRNGTPSRCAARSAPPCPKMWCSWPHSGQTYQLMFSIRPSGVTLSERNIWRALTAMSSARSCGVATIATPLSGIDWAIVSDASPVPGGRSMAR